MDSTIIFGFVTFLPCLIHLSLVRITITIIPIFVIVPCLSGLIYRWIAYRKVKYVPLIFKAVMARLDKKEQEAIDTIASAIEDLVSMGILSVVKQDKEDSEKAVFSVNFSGIVSNLVVDRVVSSEAPPNIITTLMYHSLLIFINENLRIPKPLVIALGNDLENHGNDMECGTLIFRYAAVLQKLFFESKKEFLR